MNNPLITGSGTYWEWEAAIAKARRDKPMALTCKNCDNFEYPHVFTNIRGQGCCKVMFEKNDGLGCMVMDSTSACENFSGLSGRSLDYLK